MKLKDQSKYPSLITAGIIVMLFGMIFYAGIGFIDDPQSPHRDDYPSQDDFEKAQEEYREDIEFHKDSTRMVQTIGKVIQYTGLGILSVSMIALAIYDKKLSPNVRFGLLITAGLILGLIVGLESI